MMAFSHRSVGLDDAEDITRIFQVAFKDNPVEGQLYPKTPANLVWDKDLKWFTELIAQGDVYGGHFTKVVENHTGYMKTFHQSLHYLDSLCSSLIAFLS